LEKALDHREENTSIATSFDEFKDHLNRKPGFIKAMWCGDVACENLIKEETTATSRCIPFEQESLSETCICCDKPAIEMVYWASVSIHEVFYLDRKRGSKILHTLGPPFFILFSVPFVLK
jgi:hypothetical protein